MPGIRKDAMSINKMRFHSRIKGWAKRWTSKARRRLAKIALR